MRARRSGLLLLALALWLGALGRDAADGWIDAAPLPPLARAESVRVTDRDGRLLHLATTAGGLWRLGAAPTEVDPLYLAMLMAWEDRRFDDHPGVDARALARAAWQALRHRRAVSGASTLSMQAVRLLTGEGTRSPSGKLSQMRAALALERRAGKAGVLELYLARAPFGGNVEGIAAASLAWFGKPPRRLTPAEAALLVALPQSPEARRPDRHPEAARAARARVLARAEAMGIIDAEAAAAANAAPLPTTRRPMPRLAPHLAARAGAERPAASVHALTLSAPLQAAMERLAAEAAAGAPPEVSVAILALDHGSGEILASVGSPAYAEARQGYVDMTRALRSPGSTLKPLVYGLAFGQGIAHPETMVEDRPGAWGGWSPENFDGLYMGEMRAAEALRLSRNLPAVALADALGPEAILSAMERAGMAPAIPGGRPGLAIALGGAGTTLEDLARLYAAIARGGMPAPLSWRLGEAAPAGAARVLPRAAAWQVGDALSRIAPPAGFAPGIAWKTGTSYGHRDALAIGWDGRHVVAVWMGRPDGTPVPGAFGAEAAAPVLFSAFDALGRAPLPAPPPEALTVPASRLPQPLRRLAPASEGPQIAFPPDGATVERLGGALHARLRGGAPPFTWLAGGAPVAVGLPGPEAVIEGLGPGFMDLTAIDAEGRAARARVELR